MDYSVLKNKRCLIVGATGGIGQCIAMEIAKYNCELFLTSNEIKKLKKLKGELEALQGKESVVYYEYGDLNKVQDVSKIITAVRKKIRSVDILINCAGIFELKSLSNLNLNNFNKTFNLNVRAPFLFCKEFSKDMVKNGWGRIINIASSSAYAGFKNTSLYCASKHALLGFSRALHDELKASNIRVFCLSPGSVKTRMGKILKDQKFATFIDPKEIAEYVVFISSFNGEVVSNEVRLNRMIIE